MFKLLVLAAIAAVVFASVHVHADFSGLMASHHARIERASNY